MTRTTAAVSLIMLLFTPAVVSCASSVVGPGPSEAPVSCTAIGFTEGVSVDLSDVLDPEGGFYFTEIRIDALDASSVGEFAGNDEFPRFAVLEADLGPEPIRVDVVVTSTRGSGTDPATATEVYTASDEVLPELFQPNGADCDEEKYGSWLRATVDGELLEVPRGPS